MDIQVKVRVASLSQPSLENLTRFLYGRYDEVSAAYMELSSLSLGRNYKQKEVSFWLSLLPRNQDTDLEQALTGFMFLVIWIQRV
jgi:hypothetical protein